MEIHGDAERDLEDKLFYTEFNRDRSMLGSKCLPAKSDHCELLLNVMDAKLDQIKFQPRKFHTTLTVGHNQAPFRWSHSLSKDACFGSSTETNKAPMSSDGLMQTQMMEKISEDMPGRWNNVVTIRKPQTKLDRSISNKEETDSWKEQVMWRLERLLGDACNEKKLAEETRPPSESICTEDFVSRFTEEMVELTLPDSKQKLDEKIKAKRTGNSNGDSCVNNLSGASVERQQTAGAKQSQNDPLMSHFLKSINHTRRKQDKTGLSQKHEVNMSLVSQEKKPEKKGKASQKPGDEDTVPQKTEIVTNPGGVLPSRSSYPKPKYLAGVPVQSFDTDSIDSDLDTICSEQVRQHVYKWTGWMPPVQSDVDDLCADWSDDGSTTQEENEPLSTSESCSSYQCLPNPRFSAHQDQHNVKEIWSDDKDTDDDMRRTSGKTLTDLLNMREQLLNFKQEDKLTLKRTDLDDPELVLSQVQQNLEHILEDLELLAGENVEMQKQKNTLESILSDRKAEKDVVSWQPEKLQTLSESCLLELKTSKEALASVVQFQTVLEEASCMTKSHVTSALELEDLEVDFTEQQGQRDKNASLQEVKNLEEIYEELERNTLKNRCVCLEEKQTQTSNQTLEVQLNQLQFDLGEHEIRIRKPDDIFTQKEKQLLELQKKRGSLQKEKVDLSRGLKYLNTQHHEELKEAHIMKLKDEEVTRTKTFLLQERKKTEKQQEFQANAIRKVVSAVKQERKNCEEEDAMKKNCGILKVENKKSLESLMREMEREKNKSLTLQHQVKMQELELGSRAQQRDQECLLAAISKSLKEEHQAELQLLYTYLTQSQRRTQKLEQAVRLAVKNSDRLQVKVEEMENIQKLSRAELEQQIQLWTQQLKGECQHLYALMEQSAEKPPKSLSIDDALTNLRAVRKNLKHFIRNLRQDLDSQKQAKEQLKNDMEQDMKIQEQHLIMERDEALNRVKERLIQDHIEELSTVKRACMSGRGDDGGGMVAFLRKKLDAKDQELQQVQRNMGKWKERTAARLACKFKEELTAELERCKAKLMRGRKAPGMEETRAEGEMKEEQRAFSSPCSPLAVDSHHHCDLAPFKLLHHLEKRVKQVCVENQVFRWSPSPLDNVLLDI